MTDSSSGVKEKRRSGARLSGYGNKGDVKRALFENDDILHLLSDGSGDLIMHLQLHPKWRLTYVSPSSERITGYTPEEYYASPEIVLDNIHPYDKEIFRGFLDTDYPAGNGPVTLRWIHKDGRIIWMEQTTYVVRNKSAEALDVFFRCREITRRKEAEEALRESQKFVSSLLENAPHPIMVINTDTSIRYVNPAWEELNGWTLSEIINTRAPYPWWPDDMRDAFLEGFMNAMNQSKGQGQVISRKKNGELYWVDMNWAGVVHNGELQYILINSVDITERRNLEQLQSGENRVLTLLAQGADLQEILDEIVRLGEANDPTIKGSILLLDSTRNRLVLKSAPSMPAEFLEIYKDGLDIKRYVGSCGTAAFLKQRVIVPDIIDSRYFRFKNVVDVAVKTGLFACWSQPIISSGGEILGTISNYCDHTGGPSQANLNVLEWSARIAAIAIERRRAEEELAGEAIRRRILVEQSSDGIVILDQNGKVFEANRRFAEMLGYSVEEALKLSVWDWESSFPRERVVEMLRNIDEKGDHFETKHRRKDGSTYHVEISTNGTTFAGQKLIFCVCRDISERKQAEEALRESEEKYRSVVENANSGIIVIQDGKAVFSNAWVYQILGYRVPQNSTFDFISRIHLEDRPLAVKRIEDRLAGVLATDSVEIRITTKSGEMKWIETRSVKIQWNNRPAVQAFILDVTERKQAIEALRESEEKFSKAFHASPGSISISRIKDGKFIEVNDSFLRDKGFTREEVIGKSIVELGLADINGNRIALHKHVKEHGRVNNRLFQYRNKAGELRYAYSSSDVIKLGNEPCIITQSTDITEQKHAEDKLRLLGSITQQVSDATIVVDLDFKITHINQAAQDLLGYSMDEVQGRGMGIFNEKPLAAASRQSILKVLSSGKVWRGTVTKRKKDGSLIICESKLSPLLDENGVTQSYIDILRDVTRQKETEAKLKIQRQLNERILATMPEGVIVTDDYDRIILMNKAFKTMFQLNKSVTRYKLVNEIIHTEQLLKSYYAVKKGERASSTLEFRHKLDEIEKVITCKVIKMYGGQILLTFTDISKEREEEEKLYLTDRLASIGEMAAGLAHELNNPLTGVLALSQLLIDSDIREEYKEDLRCVFDEARRAADIVKNVLLFARNNNYENGQASVNDVVNSVLRLREYEEKVSNITVIRDFQEDLPDVTIDKFQLQQVFLNIILNAEAAIRDTGRPGELTIRTERSNNHINISFKDTGCGIKKNVLSRIFDPFYTTKEIGKGTGLGLSICYGIVVKNSGRISVQSQLNEGSTFTVRMPIVPSKRTGKTE